LHPDFDETLLKKGELGEIERFERKKFRKLLDQLIGTEKVL